MRTIGVILMLGLLVFVAANTFGATSKPATGPKEGEDTLLDGEIIFTPPDGWQELTRNAKSVQYGSPDHKGNLVITATQQVVNLNKSVADQVGMLIKKRIVEQVKASGAEFVITPRVEKDDLIFLKVHDRFKKGDAVADRIQLHQMVSLDLISVISTAGSDVEDEIAAFHKAAMDLLLSARFQKLDPKTGARVPIKPKRPTTLPKNYWKAHVRILGPTGWKEEVKDNRAGDIATFTDPQSPAAKIIVQIEPVPVEIQEGDPRVEKLADDMLDRQELAAKRAGREAQGEIESQDDPAYLRKTRTRYSGKPQPTVVSSRVLQVGNALVNVMTEAPADHSSRVEKLADGWAKENITPMGLKEIQQQERTAKSSTQPKPGIELPAP